MNGRRKGARAEIQVAALLQGWWRGLEPGCVFKRTPSSGGWATPEVRGAFKVAGDLVTTAVRFPWCVEVKSREAWSIDNVREGRASPVWGWWAQAGRQAAEQPGSEPMLWVRHRREPWRVMVRVGWRDALDGEAYDRVWWCTEFSPPWGEGERSDRPTVLWAANLLGEEPRHFARPARAMRVR